MAGILKALGQTALNVAEGTANLAEKSTRGTFNLANVGVEKGLAVSTNTLSKTLDTVDVAQNAANEITQNIVKVGQQAVESGSDLAKEGAKTSASVGKQGLRVADSATKNTADITVVGLDTTSSISKEGIQAVGQLANTSISLTKNSLVSFIGSVDNIMANTASRMRAVKERQNLTEYKKVYDELKKYTLDEFKKYINDYIYNFTKYINDQKQLMGVLVRVYKMKMCIAGRIYGHTCSPEVAEKLKTFEASVQSLLEFNKTNIYTLNSFAKIASTNIGTIPPNLSAEEYEKQLNLRMQPLYIKASKIFEDTLERFNELAKQLDVNEKSPPATPNMQQISETSSSSSSSVGLTPENTQPPLTPTSVDTTPPSQTLTPLPAPQPATTVGGNHKYGYKRSVKKTKRTKRTNKKRKNNKTRGCRKCQRV